jgi:hypothetical protein
VQPIQHTSFPDPHRGRTDRGDAHTSLLVSTAHFGPERRLWLAEPVGQACDRSALGYAPVPDPSPALGVDECRIREIRDQIEAWVNEGGTGDDVAS